jgi:protease-4
MIRFSRFRLNVVVTVCLAVAVWLSIPAVAPGQDTGQDPLQKTGSSNIPSYHRQLDFNLTSPGTWATAVGGYANPGVYSMLPGGEAEFFWTDQNLDALSGWRRWGLFLGGEHIGFGTVYNRVVDPESGESVSVTDYRLGFSLGDRSTSLGFAYGWSGGSKDQFHRTRVLQVGMVQRPSRYLSFGAAGVFSTEQRDQTGLFDVGIRPLGTHMLSLFGDLELPRGVGLKDAPWSFGAMVEWPAGLRLIGRYYEDESWNLSVAYTFGGGINTGQLKLTGSPRFNSDNEVGYTNWGVRLGYPERSFIGEYYQRDRYYVTMNLKGAVVHKRFAFFDSKRTLMGMLKSLEDAKDDDRISGVVISLSGLRISRGNAWEIREKLAELQDHGKRVVVYFDEATLTHYHLASVADRVVMDPEGMMLMPGYVLGRTYLAGTLEKLGLGFDEWRFLEYKSAAETYSRRSMSDADREQRQALVDEFYETTRADVMKSRGISADEFDRWIDEVTVVTPAGALEAGIVDELARWTDIRNVVENLEKSSKPFVAPRMVAGSFYKSQQWGEPPAIAVVYAIGECAMDSGIRARQLEPLLIALGKSRRVKAVVLRVNSPGGSALASDLVAEAIRKCAEQKPVVISQGDVAASGGYWISMYGDEILAQPTTITGSIGVIGGWIWNDGLGEKLGLDTDFVRRGEHADLFFGPKLPFTPIQFPHRPMTETERERVMDEMKSLYAGFVKKVAAGREMSERDVENVAQGRVWTGRQGRDNGLVDQIGGLNDAIRVARERAGIDPDLDVEVLDFSSRGWFDIMALIPNPIPFGWWPGGKDRLEALDTSGEADLGERYELLYLREIARYNGRPLCLIPPEYLPVEANVGFQPLVGESDE